MRRNIVSMLGALSILLLGMMPAAAGQDSTPESGLAAAGFPTIEVTVTESGFEGVPETLEAGRYHLIVSVADDAGDFGGGIAFLQPVGVTVDEFLGAISGPPEESGAAPEAGTPADGDEGGDEDMGAPPPFIFDSVFAGGAFADPGQTAEVILDLGPGEWIAWGDSPEATQEPVVFEVTGELPDDLDGPESSATLTMGEYVIAVSEGELTSGSQVVRIDNAGAQPHFIAWFILPDGTTEEDIQTVFDEEAEAQMTGTPPAYSGLNPEEDIVDVTFTGTQSMGTSIWIEVEIEAGTHGLACFFPDISDGMPHANYGMFAVVEVGE